MYTPLKHPLQSMMKYKHGEIQVGTVGEMQVGTVMIRPLWERHNTTGFRYTAGDTLSLG